jgi:TPR repeat protein
MSKLTVVAALLPFVAPSAHAAAAAVASEAAEARARCDGYEARRDDDPEARRALGVCYLLGQGRLTDHGTALALFDSAAEAGSTDARFALAAALLFRARVPSRFAEAHATLRAMADEGYEAAHFPLAVSYAAGLGTAEDLGAAVSHFDVAARYGDDVAAWLLAVAHRYGLLGLAVSPARAYDYVLQYQANLARQFPGLVMNEVHLRTAVLALHHDRLLRRYVFTDEQLELFPALAREVIGQRDLADLREGWGPAGE